MSSRALIVGYQFAGLLLAVVETSRRASDLPLEYRITLKHTFVILLAAGAALGITRVVLRHVSQRLQMRAEVWCPAAIAVMSYALSSDLMRGVWISRQWYAPYAPATIAASLATAVWIGMRVARDRAAARHPAFAPTALFVAAGVVTYLDAHVLVGLYPRWHEALLGLAWVCGGEASAHVADLSSRSAAGKTIREGLLVAACGLSLSVPLVWAKAPGLSQRAVWARSPGHSKTVYEWAPRTYRNLIRMSRPSTGGYARPLADWIAQQHNAERLARPLAAGAWAGLAPVPSQRRGLSDAAVGQRPNIVLITVDALRADVAYDSASGPFHSDLLAKGRVYQRGYSASAVTHMSLATLFTGRSHWQEQQKNIFTRLNEASYDTAFVTTSHVVSWLQAQEQRWIDDASTALTVDRMEGATSEAITAKALSWLEQRRTDRPAFLWVHYYDVHEWAAFPAEASEDKASRYTRVWKKVQIAVGRLLDGQKQMLGNRPTALLFASDHGEYLGEIGRTGHGRWLGLPSVHVPVVVVAPGYPPSVVERPVALIDVAPTVAHLAGMTHEPAEGVSLLLDDVDPMRPLLMGDVYEIAISRGAHRLVLNPDSSLIQVFDESNPKVAREIELRLVKNLERAFLLPLLGSSMAAEATSPLVDR